MLNIEIKNVQFINIFVQFEYYFISITNNNPNNFSSISFNNVMINNVSTKGYFIYIGFSEKKISFVLVEITNVKIASFIL